MERYTHKSLIKKWANALQGSPKKKSSLKLNTASHNNASWYTDTGGFLEHSPSWGSLYSKEPALQKIILVWGGPTLVIKQYLVLRATSVKLNI